VKKEMGVRRILPKSQVNQDATRVGAGAEWRRAGMLASPRPPANTPIYANHVGGNNEHMVMHRIGIFGSTGATRQGSLPPGVLSQARRKRPMLPTYRT
jgi:hypothetical protein